MKKFCDLIKKFLLFSLLLLLPSFGIFAEIISLKNGNTISGQIIEQNRDFIKIKTSQEIELKYYRDEIEKISDFKDRIDQEDNRESDTHFRQTPPPKLSVSLDDPYIAIKYYKTVLEDHPDDEQAYRGLGSAYAALGKQEQALEYYLKAYDISGHYHPDMALIFYNKGTHAFENKDFEKAVDYLTRALEINPALLQAYLNRGNVYYTLGELEMALNDYASVTEINPQRADIYTNIGNLYLTAEDYDEAIKFYRMSLNRDPDYAPAYYSRSIALFAKKRFSESHQDLITAEHLGYQVHEPFKRDLLNQIKATKAQKNPAFKQNINRNNFREQTIGSVFLLIIIVLLFIVFGTAFVLLFSEKRKSKIIKSSKSAFTPNPENHISHPEITPAIQEEINPTAKKIFHKPSAYKRVCAYLIDLMLTFVIHFFLVVLFRWNIFIIIFALYFLLRDSFTGRSPGKALINLKVVQDNNDDIDFLQGLSRNLTLIIPFLAIFEYFIMYFDRLGKRWGDQWAKTKVHDLNPRKDDQVYMILSAVIILVLGILLAQGLLTP